MASFSGACPPGPSIAQVTQRDRGVATSSKKRSDLLSDESKRIAEAHRYGRCVFVEDRCGVEPSRSVQRPWSYRTGQRSTTRKGFLGRPRASRRITSPRSLFPPTVRFVWLPLIPRGCPSDPSPSALVPDDDCGIAERRAARGALRRAARHTTFFPISLLVPARAGYASRHCRAKRPEPVSDAQRELARGSRRSPRMREPRGGSDSHLSSGRSGGCCADRCSVGPNPLNPVELHYLPGPRSEGST